MFALPYGKRNLQFEIPEYFLYPPDFFLAPGGRRKNKITKRDISSLISKKFNNIELCRGDRVAIVLNDATRPIPYAHMLPPLLENIIAKGVDRKHIAFFIAAGTHRSLSKSELRKIISTQIFDKYRTLVHNCDAVEQLKFLGESDSGTPIYINKEFYESDFKILTGQIEPHHFMGYSGGVKSAVIGLGGRKTIEINHKMLTDQHATIGTYETNPMRMDVEQIGKTLGIDLVFNVVLDDQKKIINALLDTPEKVMQEGIALSNNLCRIKIENTYDLVICSPGGYPKDINLYQAQKAITHACTFLKRNGMIILAAECREGLGSKSFEKFIGGKSSPEEIIDVFNKSQFSIGPHKAFQLALQALNHHLILVSDYQNQRVVKSVLKLANNMHQAIGLAAQRLPNTARIAILPYATHIFNQLQV